MSNEFGQRKFVSGRHARTHARTILTLKPGFDLKQSSEVVGTAKMLSILINVPTFPVE